VDVGRGDDIAHTAGPAEGPLVPEEWIPAVEQPAHPRPAPPLAVVGVVAGVLFGCLLVAFVLGQWYTRALLETSMAGVEAALSNDVAALEPLMMAQTASTPEFKAALAASSRDTSVTFGEPVWSGGVSVNFEYGGQPGWFALRPAWDSIGEALLEWSGPPFGAGTGRVALIDEAGGWRLYSFNVGKRGASFAPEDAKTTFRAPGG
jgi:hypothetical protein